MPYIRVPKLSGSHPVVLDTAVQVKLRWTLNGVQCLNVLGGRVAGGWSNNQAHADDLADAIGAAFDDQVRNYMASTTTLDGVGIRDLRAANLVEYEANTINMAGTSAGQPLPNALAAVVTLRTAFAGKSYRGRIYYSGSTEDQGNDATGKISSGLGDALVGFTVAVQTAMAAEGITLAVLSMPRYANLPPPADVETWPGAVTDVTAIQMRDRIWDSQRRRRT